MLCQVPFAAVFLSDDSNRAPWIVSMDWMLCGCLIADVLLNFVTTENDPATLLPRTDLPSIAKEYLCGFFVVDAVSSIPWEHVLSSDAADFMRWARVLRFIGVVSHLPRMQAY